MSSTTDLPEAAADSRARRRRFDRLLAVAEIARDATARRSINELLQLAVDLIQERLGFYHVAIFLLDEASSYVVLRAVASPAGPTLLAQGHRLQVGSQSMIGFVAETGLPRISEDVATDQVYYQNPLLAETRSEISLPLKVMERITGVLDVQSQVENDFDFEDVRALQTMADQLAVALENARLYEDDQRKLRELGVLNEVATACAQIDNEDLLIERVTQIIGQAIYTHNFGILLLDTDRKLISKHPSYRMRIQEKVESYPSNAGVVGKVLNEGRPLRLGDVSQEPAYLEVDPGIKSELCVPILIGGEAIGVINTENSELNAFTTADEQLLTTVAGTLGSALQRLRIHARERRRHAELEAVRQAALQFTSTLELDALLKVILNQTLQLTAAENAHIFFYDGIRLTFGAALFRETGFQERPLAEPRQEGISYTVARSAQRIIIQDMRAHPMYADQDWEGSIVGIPLRLGDQVLGVMNVACARPQAFSEDELNSLGLLADQAAIALANARLFAESLRKAQALAQAYSQQQEFDRMKSNFIASVSGELRTPVSVILGYAELLEGGDLGDLNTDQQDAISVIARRARLLTKLLDNLTTILESESGEMRWERVDLGELVEELIGEIRREFTQAHVKLSKRLEIGLPRIMGVRSHLRRSFENLLNNAFKFTPDEGSVHVELKREDNFIVFLVKDSGIGIAPADLERIFERFYQVENASTRRMSGVGLGLSLVKQVAESHRGMVGVESEPGKGSTFWIKLPIE